MYPNERILISDSRNSQTIGTAYPDGSFGLENVFSGPTIRYDELFDFPEFGALWVTNLLQLTIEEKDAISKDYFSDTKHFARYGEAMPGIAFLARVFNIALEGIWSRIQQTPFEYIILSRHISQGQVDIDYAKERIRVVQPVIYVAALASYDPILSASQIITANTFFDKYVPSRPIYNLIGRPPQKEKEPLPTAV